MIFLNFLAQYDNTKLAQEGVFVYRKADEYELLSVKRTMKEVFLGRQQNELLVAFLLRSPENDPPSTVQYT